MLTRGVVDDPNKQTAENTKALVEATKSLGKDIATELADLLNSNPESVSFVEVA